MTLGLIMVGAVVLVAQYKKKHNDVVEPQQLQTARHHSYEFQFAHLMERFVPE